jgi:hypothetical protein
MKQKVEKIKAHGINCFVNRQLIYNWPEQLFADSGITSIEHADFEGVERLALVTGMPLLLDLFPKLYAQPKKKQVAKLLPLLTTLSLSKLDTVTSLKRSLLERTSSSSSLVWLLVKPVPLSFEEPRVKFLMKPSARSMMLFVFSLRLFESPALFLAVAARKWSCQRPLMLSQ